MIKNKEIKSFPKEELFKALQENKKSLLDLKIKNTLGQLTDTASISMTRKTIARLKTQITKLDNKVS